MKKPPAIHWLESETGQSISYPESTESTISDRHLSVRISASQSQDLERLAKVEHLSVSQFVRRLIVTATAESTSSPGETTHLLNRIEADTKELRRRLVS